MNKIHKASYIFRIFFQIMFYLAPVICALFWMFYNNFMKLGLVHMPVPGNLISLTPLTSLIAFFVSLLPLSIAMYGLYQLINLFRNYEIYKIFAIENVKYFRRLGYTLFAWVVVGLFYDALLSMALTLNNAPGKHLIAVSISGVDLTTLLIGGIILIIAWVMSEGHKLAEEQMHIV